MKTELTPEEIEELKQYMEEWLKEADHAPYITPAQMRYILSLLTKQEEQPKANDGGKFPKSTWEVDALRRKVKRFEEKIQSLKQANAELVEGLEDLHEELLSHSVSCDAMAQSEAKSGNVYAEVIWLNKKGAFMVAANEVKKILSKHDKQ